MAHSIFWITWSRGVLQLLNFATTLLVARILMPADYGLMALAGFWTGMAGVLADMGLGSAIIQFRNLNKREIDTCFWLTMTLATACCIALSLSAPEIARWFAAPRLAEVLPALSLVLPLTACRVVSDSLLRQRLALDRVSQAEVISTMVSLPLTLGCALAGLGVWTLVIGSLVTPTVRSAATFAFAPWCPGLRIGGARVKEVVHFSLATLGVKMMWALREWGNTLVIGKVTGQVDTVGLYTMAEEIALLPATKISTVVNMLSSPVMAELQGDIDAMRTAFYRAVRLTAAIALPVSAGMALVAEDMVAVLLGPKWLSIVPILRLLCLYAGVRGIDILLPPVLFARRRERFLFWYCLMLLILAPAAGVIGAVWNGAQGTVMLATPVYCAVMAVMAREALTEMEAEFSELWACLWPIIAATALMAVTVLLLQQFALAERPDPPLVRLLFLSASGAIVYGATLFAIGSPVISEGAEVLGWILRRRRADS
ncbi:MAG TPA: lipopolysaccharide biosynthesis protein [Stellaceae bacterium]|nr:lipopolysaccharide biosynthesis protein [Stellaceae bacterium]